MPQAPSSPAAPHAFRPDIEGLRGIAILLVIAYHVGLPGITGGYVGVDVFFVLSGYLITGLLVREVLSTGRVDFVQFYARRGRRLLPAAVVVLMVTLVAGWIILSPTEIHDLTVSVTAASTYISNALFAYKSTNYLADDARSNPVLHTWSLAVEEQFYLVWPLLVAAALRWRRRDRSSTSATSTLDDEHRPDSIGRLILVVGVVSILSFVLCVGLTQFAQAWAFFGAPARVWEFGAGALGTLLEAQVVRRYSRFVPIVSAAGALMLGVAALLYTTSTRFPGAAALLPVAGTVAMLLGGYTVPGVVRRTPLVTRLLASRGLQIIGRLSYSWYLWHWPVLTFAWILQPHMGLSGRLMCVGLSWVLAIVMYFAIETPIRYRQAFRFRSRTSVIAALGLTAASVLIAQSVRLRADRAARAPAQALFSKAHDDFTRLTLSGCTLSYWGVEPKPGCEFGDVASDTTVVLFGDSHADHWFPAAEQVAGDRHWRLLTFSKSECPSVTVPLTSRKLGREYTECAHWRADVIQRIIARRPMLVVLSNSSAYVPRPTESLAESQVSASAWEHGLRSTVSAFSQAGIRTLVIEDVLRPNFNVPVCLARHAWSSLWKSTRCTFERDRALNTAVVQAEQRGLQGIALATLANVNPLLCQTTECQTARNDTVMYRDAHHFTATFSRGLAPWLSEQMHVASEGAATGPRS